MPLGQDIALLSVTQKGQRRRRWGGELLTVEEALHRFAVGHFQEAAARIGGQGGVGAVGQ